MKFYLVYRHGEMYYIASSYAKAHDWVLNKKYHSWGDDYDIEEIEVGS